MPLAAPIHPAENPSALRPAWLRLNGLLVAGLGLMALSGHAQIPDLEIGVRSKIADGRPVWNKEGTMADGEHSMIYGIVAVKQVDSEYRLVKPVDEKRVTSILMDTLDANGFREFLPGERPAILISASFGRGEVTNPYIRDHGEVSGSEGFPSPLGRPPLALDSQPAAGAPPIGQNSSPMTLDNGAPAQTITGADARQLFDEKGHGYEAKLQKAQYEKLFIRVTAWTYPDDPKEKPRMLWKTVMVVDDPDHRDLNQVVAAMLAAGGPYFDKLHREPEVEVHKPLPEGRVNVGVPQVGAPFRTEPQK